MPGFLSLSGRLLAADAPALHAANRAFRQGYALVETMLLRDGIVPLAALHWERLLHSMKVLDIANLKHFHQSDLEAAILRLAQANGHPALARIRLQLWPGNGGLYEPYPTRPDYLIESWALDEGQVSFNENGLVLGIAEGFAKAPDQIANLKTANALIYALAARAAKAARWNDALIRNTDGRIIESTIANVWWVKDGQVYTPPLSEGCVAGVARQALMTEVLPKLRLSCHEQLLNEDTLYDADEIFLTNALRGLRWVATCGATTYSNAIAKEISVGWHQFVKAR